MVVATAHLLVVQWRGEGGHQYLQPQPDPRPQPQTTSRAHIQSPMPEMVATFMGMAGDQVNEYVV